jgi:TRAP-type C4-dicarboxylate transport system substrate-binding protein
MRALALVLLTAGICRADPIVLRMASVAPDGTSWARELKALSREVEQSTGGQVKMKWYLGGIAGSDLDAGDRVARGQLDGVAGGVWQCERWAPSMKVTRLPGMFHSRAELKYVAQRLRPLLDEEFKKAGFVNLADTTLGPSMIFLRKPVSTFAELTKVRLWSLKDDMTKRKLLGAMGLTPIPYSFDESREAYDHGLVDGFLAPPAGALGFQWSTQARYLVDVVTDDILGCMVVTSRALDRISIENRQLLSAATAKFILRLEDVGTHMDEQLLGGLFEKQGVTIVRPDPKFRADFDQAARASWDKAGLVPAALIAEVQTLLNEFRGREQR